MKLVLGGGLSGLSAAYYLGRKGVQVCLVEKASRVGGWVRTEKDPATGILVETGPHTVRPAGVAGHNTLKLLADLGQTADDLIVVTSTHPAATKRLIYLDSTLHYLPSSFGSLFRSSRLFSKPLVFSFLKDLLTPRKISDDESAYDFIERRFGKDLADNAISPMLCGVCAGDAKEISIKSLFPIIYQAEQNHGSVIKGFAMSAINSSKLKPLPEFPNSSSWRVWAHKKGLSTVIDILKDRIMHQGGSLYLSSKISNLDFNDKSVTCKINGNNHEFSHVISSLPSYSLASILPQKHSALSDLLNEIPFATVAVVNVIFKGNHIKDEAFGFVVPPSQNISLLGIIYYSCIYPQGDYTILTAMLGGRWYNKYFSPSTTESELKDITLDYFKSILNIKDDPVSCKISISKDCIPQYTLGHSERVDKINNYINENNLPLSLVGSSYEGIGVNDVIFSAKKAVDKLLP